MATSIVRGAAIQPARIASAAGGLDKGYLDATGLAEYLVTRGVPFRTAHQIVGSIVRRCEDSARDTATAITADELREELRSAARRLSHHQQQSEFRMDRRRERAARYVSTRKSGFRGTSPRTRKETNKQPTDAGSSMPGHAVKHKLQYTRRDQTSSSSLPARDLR